MHEYDWHGWDAETELGNDDDREGVYYLTITEDGEEMATIFHRVCGGKYPLDGVVAQEKCANADRIVTALRAASAGGTHVVVAGSPIDGVKMYGPFESSDDALKWAQFESFGGDPWWLAEIEAPA